MCIESCTIGMGIAKEACSRNRQGSGAATQLIFLIKQPYCHAIHCHVIGNEEPLMATPNHHHIETCISHL